MLLMRLLLEAAVVCDSSATPFFKEGPVSSFAVCNEGISSQLVGPYFRVVDTCCQPAIYLDSSKQGVCPELVFCKSLHLSPRTAVGSFGWRLLGNSKQTTGHVLRRSLFRPQSLAHERVLVNRPASQPFFFYAFIFSLEIS